MKRMFSFSLIASVLSGSLFAESNTNDSQFFEKNIRGQMQVKSVSDSVDKGWTIDGSLLYWNAKIDGYEFAESTQVSTNIEGGVPVSIQAKAASETPAFNHWDPGFQLGLGYVFSEREQWHARLAWTRFNTDAHRSLKALDGESNVLPLLLPFLMGSSADKASAHWDLDFDTLDLELGRPFFVGKWLSLFPKVGLRGAWIDQHFKAKYHAFFPLVGEFKNTSIKLHQEFKGVGLRIGSDIQFYLGRDWSILGNLSTCLLWGNSDLKEKIQGFLLIAPDVSESAVASKASDVIRANLEGQLGLQWQLYYRENKYRVACSALYNFAYWFKQNRMMNQVVILEPGQSVPTFQEIFHEGDLHMQGVNVKVALDF